MGRPLPDRIPALPGGTDDDPDDAHYVVRWVGGLALHPRNPQVLAAHFLLVECDAFGRPVVGRTPRVRVAAVSAGLLPALVHESIWRRGRYVGDAPLDRATFLVRAHPDTVESRSDHATRRRPRAIGVDAVGTDTPAAAARDAEAPDVRIPAAFWGAGAATAEAIDAGRRAVRSAVVLRGARPGVAREGERHVDVSGDAVDLIFPTAEIGRAFYWPDNYLAHVLLGSDRVDNQYPTLYDPALTGYRTDEELPRDRVAYVRLRPHVFDDVVQTAALLGVDSDVRERAATSRKDAVGALQQDGVPVAPLRARFPFDGWTRLDVRGRYVPDGAGGAGRRVFVVARIVEHYWRMPWRELEHDRDNLGGVAGRERGDGEGASGWAVTLHPAPDGTTIQDPDQGAPGTTLASREIPGCVPRNPGPDAVRPNRRPTQPSAPGRVYAGGPVTDTSPNLSGGDGRRRIRLAAARAGDPASRAPADFTKRVREAAQTLGGWVSDDYGLPGKPAEGRRRATRSAAVVEVRVGDNYAYAVELENDGTTEQFATLCLADRDLGRITDAGVFRTELERYLEGRRGWAQAGSANRVRAKAFHLRGARATRELGKRLGRVLGLPPALPPERRPGRDVSGDERAA